MYFCFFLNLMMYFFVLVLSFPCFSFSLSEQYFYRKKSDFDQYQYWSDQKNLEKIRAKHFFVQKKKNRQIQKDQQRLQAVRVFSRETEKRKAQILFQSFLKSYKSKSKFYLKKKWLAKRKREQKLRKKYSTPLDVHLFFKPLSLRKR